MRKLISAIMALAMTAGVMASLAVTASAETTLSGSGTESDPYLINSVDDWQLTSTLGGYFKLTKTIEPTTVFYYKNQAILDLNGYDINTTCSKIFNVSKDLTVKNTGKTKSTVHHTSTSGTNYVFQIGTGNVLLDNITVTCDSGQAVLIGTSGGEVNLTINNCEIYGSAYGLNLTRGIVTINNSNVTSKTNVAVAASGTSNVSINGGSYSRPEATSKAHIISVSATSEVEINGARVTASTSEGSAIQIAKSYSGKLTIKDANIENTAASKNYVIMDSNEPINNVVSENTVTINGGSFSGTIGKVSKAAGTKIIITGGTFTFDPTAYVDTNNYNVTGPTDGKYTVTAKTSEIDDTVYRTADGIVSDNDGIKAAPYWTFTKDFRADATSETIKVGFKGGDIIKTADYTFGTEISGGAVTFSVFVTGANVPTDIQACLID